jgi:hypothetical protein
MYKNILITATNSLYFETLKTLIASIHRTSYNIVDKIIIYDLGLEKNEINQIKSWEKCDVFSLDNLISEKPFPTYLYPKGHAYKCFCMIHPKFLGENILWLDSGAMVLNSIQEVFDIINNEEVFVVGDVHINRNYTKKTCIDIMNASESELNDNQLWSGMIGYKVGGKYEKLFDEAYEFSKIDGCVVGDEENHRHDQSVYSILASRYNLKKYDIDIYGYWTDINRNLITAKENNAIIFVHRRGHHDTNGLLYKKDKNSKKIKLLDDTLIPYDYLCHHIVPEIPSWSRNEENPNIVVGVASNGLSQIQNYPNSIKCVWIIEPEIINGEDYKKVIDNQDKIDYIFLHDLSKKNQIDSKKFVYVFHGGTHLRQEDIKIHDKSKLVSMIFSNKQWNRYHSLRHEFYSQIKEKVDGFGTGCDKRIQFKSEGLNDYCFSIAMENFDSPGLFTEKILDCFLSGTIPIFFGTDNIDEYFNGKGFFKFNTLEELMQILETLSFEKYQEMYEYVVENFEIAKKYMFPEVYIKQFLNEIK